jgi:hypothetical protein
MPNELVKRNRKSSASVDSWAYRRTPYYYASYTEEMARAARAPLARLATLPIARATEEAIRLMVAAHFSRSRAAQSAHRRVSAHWTARTGRGTRARNGRPLARLPRCEARRVAVRDLDVATFVVYTIVEALIHHAVLTRPELLGEPFVREVADAVLGC